MKNKFIITGALALSLVTGGLTAFAATDTTVNTAPVNTVAGNVAKPTIKKVAHVVVKPTIKKAKKVMVKPTAKKAMPVTAKKAVNKKNVVKTPVAPAAVQNPTIPATN